MSTNRRLNKIVESFIKFLFMIVHIDGYIQIRAAPAVLIIAGTPDCKACSANA